MAPPENISPVCLLEALKILWISWNTNDAKQPKKFVVVFSGERSEWKNLQNSVANVNMQ